MACAPPSSMTCPHIHCKDLVTIHDLTLYPRSGLVTCPRCGVRHRAGSLDCWDPCFEGFIRPVGHLHQGG